ncbi:helix-turn-helix transcriptional regulator [Mycolicibacterium cosmeticum]|uniref:helix-turn-helix transcriptional regulator n=1 Tax=Mycolicibacterium cosmeticum TaxID=258533 RepID=UPI003204A5F1
MSWPLTGRSAEMSAIAAAIAAPGIPGVVVCGAAGVGKSRIAREALSASAARGALTRWAVATSSARTLPLGAFTAWAQAGLTDPIRLVHGVIEALTTAAPGVPVVIGVDDAPLLDDLSTFVVQQIVQRGAAKVVLTVRDDEPVPAAVQEIWHGADFDRIDLEPLASDEVAALLAAALGGPVDPDAAQRLWEMTRGNALYLHNLVEQEVADGRLENPHGPWHWTGDPVVAPGLVELIEARMGDLPAPVSEVVDVLAVGEPIELGALTRIAGAPAVEAADARGLIKLNSVDGAVEVRVAHPLYGEVRRKRAAPTRLRRLRGLVAGELAGSADRDDLRVVVRRATLTMDSDTKPDPALLVRAAHGAVWLADLPLADRLAEAAIQAGAGWEANFVRAHALSWLSQGDAADAVLAGIDVDDLSDVDRDRFVFLRASNMLWVLQDPVRAKALIDAAAAGPPARRSGYLEAFRTVYWFAMDQPELAVEAAEDLVLEELPAVAAAEVAWALAAICADAGRTEQSVAIADAGYAIAARSFDAPQMRFNIADAHVSALLLAGRVGEAHDVADRVRTQAADLPGAAHLLGAAVVGRAALGAGRLDTAETLLDSAASALSASGHAIGWGFRYHYPRAMGLAIQGAAREAAGVLAEFDDRTRPFRSLDYERSLAHAWVAASEGAVSQAVATLADAAHRACARGQFAAEVVCLQTAVQFGDPSGATRLRELAGKVGGPRAGVAARFAEALGAGDAGELAAVSVEFERMGDLVAAVDASALAAAECRRRELRGSALTSATRAESLAGRCGGADTPALRAVTERLPFTGREREIVMLAAQGLSNRAIAERLTVSVRTVESHMYRAMAKTGTSSREELAALFPRG